MAEIVITMQVDDELCDADDSTGLTSNAYDDIFGDLLQYGTDIAIRKGAD